MWVLEEISFCVFCSLVTALSPDSQMHTGTRKLLRQFKHGYVTVKNEIGGKIELNEESTFFSSGDYDF